MIPIRDDNPTNTTPVITISLIIINVVAFLYELTLGSEHAVKAFFTDFAIVPAEFRMTDPGGYFSIITSMFLHGSLLHLVGNMLYLWIFGNNIEDSVGHFRFVAFYFLSGIAAGMAHLLSAPDSMIPTIGASGAVSGVLGAYFLLFPHARVLALIPFGFYWETVAVPAGFLLVFWFFMQIASGWATLGVEAGGVAWWAHVGGFIAGCALIPMMKKPRVHYFNPRRRQS